MFTAGNKRQSGSKIKVKQTERKKPSERTHNGYKRPVSSWAYCYCN
jgi:hypothetical protein